MIRCTPACSTSAYVFGSFLVLLSGTFCSAEDQALTVVAVLVDETALAGAHDVQLQGNLAFVAGKGGSLAIIDVADTARPQIIWSRRDAQALEDAETVLPAGEHLFLGTRDFHALEVRDPRQPRILHTVADRPRIDRINGMARRGDLIVAANKNGWIDVLDVSQPAQPKLFGALDVRTRDSMQSPHDIALLGDLLVIVDAAGFGRTEAQGQVGVYRFVDVASRAVLPPEHWPLVGRLVRPQLAGANRVHVAGNYAYVAGSLSPQAIDRATRQAHVSIIDLSRPEQPALVSAVAFPDPRGPNGLAVTGKAIFAAGGQTIMAIDVTDPRRPEVLVTCKCPEVFRGSPGEDDAHDLVYRDDHLYVTGQTTHSFGIVRITDPRLRRLLAVEASR